MTATKSRRAPNASARLYAHLITLGDGAERATNAELAEALGVDLRTVTKALRELRKAGLVECTYGIPNSAGFGTEPSARRLHVVAPGGDRS